MFSAHARWLLLVGLSSVAFVACGGDDPAPSGMAGSPSGGSSAGSQVGGSPSTGGSTSGSTSGGSGGAGTTAGSGGASTGGGGAGTAGGSAGGGGAGGAGGSGGASGGGGAGGAAGPSKTVNIMGVNGMDVTGTVTFTQGATMTKMVLTLTECPNGAHSSHLHSNNDCGDNAMAAGNHWTPNGEMLGDYTCANGMVTHEHEKPIAMWTVGGDAATDVTKHAFMVHAMPDSAGSGARIGCGTFPP